MARQTLLLMVVTLLVGCSAAPPPPPRPPPTENSGPWSIGDPQPFARMLPSGDIEWHVFFLRSLQSGTWDHLVSKDLLHWDLW